jgi:hypothetical protein
MSLAKSDIPRYNKKLTGICRRRLWPVWDRRRKTTRRYEFSIVLPFSEHPDTWEIIYKLHPSLY